MNDPTSTGVGLGLFVWITLIPLLIVLFGRSRKHEAPPPDQPQQPPEGTPPQHDAPPEKRAP